MQRVSDRSGRSGVLALCALLAAGCGPSKSGDDSGGSSAPPVIESFTSAVAAVHVGESTQLVAVFSGDTASIDGIGAVERVTPRLGTGLLLPILLG